VPGGIVNAEALRARYLTEAVETATPAARLVMIVDRLEQDLAAADRGFETGDLKTISDHLIHAQEIILTLRDTMKVDLWDGAPRMIALYDHLSGELLRANLDKDRERASRASGMLRQLADAWRAAAKSLDADSHMEAIHGVA
jgi:flagellar protein FliS